MRVLIAGATGVLGRPLVPLLLGAGHQVIALVRSPERAAGLARDGVELTSADALDAAAVRAAVQQSAPDAVVNLLTAIPSAINPRRMARDFAMTNRLRTQGTRNLLEAARDVGVGRAVCESIAFAYDPEGPALADEDTPLWPSPPKQFAPPLAALQELESRTRDFGGLILRFGHVYGPGTAFAADGSLTNQIRGGKLPLVGSGRSTFSFIHAGDAASAIAAALEVDASGALNVVDDEPAAMSEWLPFLAAQLGARKPRTLPAFLARLAVGEYGAAFLTRLRGADNSRAKQQLAWQPGYDSWRSGFAAELRPAA